MGQKPKWEYSTGNSLPQVARDRGMRDAGRGDGCVMMTSSRQAYRMHGDYHSAVGVNAAWWAWWQVRQWKQTQKQSQVGTAVRSTAREALWGGQRVLTELVREPHRLGSCGPPSMLWGPFTTKLCLIWIYVTQYWTLRLRFISQGRANQTDDPLTLASATGFPIKGGNKRILSDQKLALGKRQLSRPAKGGALGPLHRKAFQNTGDTAVFEVACAFQRADQALSFFHFCWKALQSGMCLSTQNLFSPFLLP